MKAREGSSPTPEPSLPGRPLTEGNPHCLVPPGQEYRLSSWIRGRSWAFALTPPCESSHHAAPP